MATVQNTSRFPHWRQEQRLRKISEDLVGQGSVLLLQALQLFLYSVGESLSSTLIRCITHIINWHQVNLPGQRLPLKVAAVIGDNLSQSRIKFYRIVVPGR